MNVLKAAIAGLALISANTLVRADVITDWNNTAMDVMKAVNVAGNPWTRSMALVNVSMSDAVNSVQNRYSRYMAELPIDPNASAETAAAAAAREILMRQYPGQKARIDAAFAETMQTIPDNPTRAASIALGEKAAGAVFAERQSDATNTPDTYRPLTTPGVWVPTTPPLFPQYATAKPWGMDSASQFRPAPPLRSTVLFTRAITTKPRKWAERKARSGPTRSPTPCASGHRPTLGPHGSRRPGRLPPVAASPWQKARERSH
ncbi:hypothetical protein ACF1BQ_018205 [Bradyrhizobium sp. RDT10]